MKLKHIIIGILVIVGVIAPMLVSAENYGDVTCTYYGFPIYIYACSDSHVYHNYPAMVDYYTPQLIQTEPDYTFVASGTSEGLTVVP